MPTSLFLMQELARAKAYNGAEPCNAEAFWQGCPCDDCRATDQAMTAEANERKAQSISDNENFFRSDWQAAPHKPTEEKDWYRAI